MYYSDPLEDKDFLSKFKQEEIERFKKEKEEFMEEVFKGEIPDWAPQMVSKDGRRYTDPEALMYQMLKERRK